MTAPPSPSPSPSTHDTHDEFLQSRVRLLLEILLAIGAVLFVYVMIERVVAPKEDVNSAIYYMQVLYLIVVATGRAIVGRKPRTVRTLRTVETSVFLAVALVLAGMMRHVPIGYRPELTLLLIYGIAIFGRAGLVPSSVRRTIFLCAAFTVGVAYVSYRTYEGFVSPGPGYPKQTPIGVAGFTVMFWCVMSGVAIAVSQVIYGLRREVRDVRKLGQYRLHRKLGEGGMGAVYLASHAMLRRPTAIKLLPLQKTGEHSLARFEREVQLTAGLTHPNTVTVHDYGRTPDGIFYYVMELLDGATLVDVIALTGPIPPARVIKILDQVSGALAEAHSLGLIHRDIKPANIMMVEQGGAPDVAKVLDFGLVKQIDTSGATDVTHADSITGTPAYMSPESIKSPDDVDARTDLYAVGAVGYYLLTGENVFTGSSVVEVCAAHLHETPIPPSERLGGDIPADLERLVLECLAKDPADRPQTASELQHRLRELDGYGSWTDREAHAWWEDYRSAVESKVEGRTETMSDETIDIDLHGRQNA